MHKYALYYTKIQKNTSFIRIVKKSSAQLSTDSLGYWDKICIMRLTWAAEFKSMWRKEVNIKVLLTNFQRRKQYFVWKYKYGH